MLEDKFSPISEEETILSHRSVETFSQSLAHPVSCHSLSQECAHTFMFTRAQTCKHKKLKTNTGSVFTLKKDAET